MKNLLFSVFFTCFFADAESQMLYGVILDKATKNPVEHATIFFNGTSAGVFSDVNGNFAINVSEFGKIPLSVSALGYSSIEIAYISASNHYKIYLEPKTYELDEVIVRDKGTISREEWRMYMEEFRKQFLGESMNAIRCKILNESDLFLSSYQDVLKAFAYKPLIIKNRSLGYSIQYFLDKFEYHRNDRYMILLGKIIFIDETAGMKESEKVKIEKRRRAAYFGSRMHFFRCLWNNSLDSAGFMVLGTSRKVIHYDDIVNETLPTDSIPSGKFLKNTGNLSIRFSSQLPSSTMIIHKPKIFFDRSGYFEPLDVSWSGEMAGKRVGDLLPYDYKITESLNEQDKEH